jgi:hypothetical protein
MERQAAEIRRIGLAMNLPCPLVTDSHYLMVGSSAPLIKNHTIDLVHDE